MVTMRPVTWIGVRLDFHHFHADAGLAYVGRSFAVPFSSSVHSRFHRLRLARPSTAVAALPACRFPEFPEEPFFKCSRSAVPAAPRDMVFEPRTLSLAVWKC